MRGKVWSILLSAAIFASSVNNVMIGETDTKEAERTKPKVALEENRHSIEKVTPENGMKEKSELSIDESKNMQETAFLPVWFAARNESYLERKGYFYIYVRKKGEPIDKGHWYRLNMSVDSLSAQKSQKIDWKMTYLGNMPVSKKD